MVQNTVGGIIGNIGSNASINNVTFSGAISASSGANDVGGIAGL